MSQTSIDFSDDPSGVQLLDNKLTPMKANILSSNSGTSRPSYAIAGTEWTDTTTTPWVKKYFDGTDDIILGYINATTNLFTPADGALNNLAATTAPTVNEDSADGYTVGSQWIDTTNDKAYVCVDSSVGAAVWKYTSLSLAEVQTGLTMTGKLNTLASATGGAGLNLPHGAAPTSPTNGDLWSTTAAFFARINGVTQTLLTLAGGVLTGKLTTVLSATGGAGFNLPHGAAPTSPVDGDVWTTTAGTFTRINGVTVQLSAAQLQAQYTYDQASGTSGGTSTADAWTVYPFNTEVYDDITLTLASNQISFVAGTYYMNADVMLGAADAVVGGVKARLRNVTDGTTLFNFLTGFHPAGGSSNANNYTLFMKEAKIVLAGTKTIQIEYFIDSARTTVGQGNAYTGSPANSEIERFAQWIIRKG